MSAFLGPIHTWLFGKITLQNEIIEEIIELATKQQTDRDWAGSLNQQFGVFPVGDLESIIDTTNIHGWLQKHVIQVEHKLATLITQIQKEQLLSLEAIQSVFYEQGKKQSKQNNPSSLADLWKLIQDTMLDGMPCDHALEVMEQTENRILWKRRVCVHGDYWKQAGGDINLYYTLRDSFLQGLIASLPYELKREEDATYEIRQLDSIDSVELMMEEHQNILRMLQVVRNACYQLLQGADVVYEDFYEMIDFIKFYADDHHHGKEEKILFDEMVKHLGKMGSNLITHGMLVEHEWGRLFMSDLKEALQQLKDGREEAKLDIIASAIGYVKHLTRHIEKEDQLIYQFAKNHLQPEILKQVNLDTFQFEKEATTAGVQKKYQQLLENLERKYVC